MSNAFSNTTIKCCVVLHVCRAVGFDIARGQQVLSTGERLGPSELGLLAAVGVTKVAQ